MKQVRVLVVDDSALMRKLIPQMLAVDEAINVVGTAMDGSFCLKKIEELKPNVVTLDLEMPGMNGIDTLKEIMRHNPVPVIVFSSHSTEGASVTMKALGLGAFDFVTKPKDASAHMSETARELIAKVKAAADCKLKPRMMAGVPSKPEKPPAPVGSPNKIVAIGVSTGGPQALEYVLSSLPGDFRGAITVVQHMPDGFTDMFARRLDEVCPLRVKEAQSGDLLLPGRVLICPGSRHMKVKRLPLGDIAVLSDEPRVNGHRPSVDVLLRSVAEEFRGNAVGVLMSRKPSSSGHICFSFIRITLLAWPAGISRASLSQSCLLSSSPYCAGCPRTGDCSGVWWSLRRLWPPSRPLASQISAPTEKWKPPRERCCLD